MSTWTEERDWYVSILKLLSETAMTDKHRSALKWAVQQLEKLPEHWVAAPPVAQSFKKVERIHNGEWADVEFEDIQIGDVFRIVHPPGDPTLYTALSRAKPVPGEPGNWAINTEKADPPPGLTPRPISHVSV